jgi:hypothetical protein
MKGVSVSRLRHVRWLVVKVTQVSSTNIMESFRILEEALIRLKLHCGTKDRRRELSAKDPNLRESLNG